jgi:Helicase HerA, central domain
VGTLVGERVHVPFIFKSFSPKSPEGWGEARHAGFFGRSGSGKTHAAKAMLAMSLVSLPELGAFIPDGKGDFLNAGNKDLDIISFLEKNGRQVEKIHINDLKLEDAEHFRDIMFIENVPELIMSGQKDKQMEIVESALDAFTDDNNKIIVAGNNAITVNSFLEAFNERIRFAYAQSGIQQRIDGARQKQETNMTRIVPRFAKVLARFTTGTDINSMVESVLQKGAVYFLDIGSYDSEINRFILGYIYRRFRRRSANFFHRKQYSNAIVYVDEANRFIPQTPTDENKSLAAEMIDGVKTTRQYGLAWWFADQRPAAISKDVFTQLGTYFFGRGMVAAADVANMEAIIGKEGSEIYSYVMSSSKCPFIASGQFVGIGNNDGITIPLDFFDAWESLVAANNEDFHAHLSY